MSTARREARPVKSFAVKLHNRRVIGGLMADGSTLWRFKRLTPDRAIACEKIRLTKEAVAAMFAIMAELDIPNASLEARAGTTNNGGSGAGLSTSPSKALLGVWLVETFDRSTWTHFEPWCCWTRQEAEDAAKNIMCDENLSARTRYVPFRTPNGELYRSVPSDTETTTNKQP